MDNIKEQIASRGMADLEKQVAEMKAKKNAERSAKIKAAWARRKAEKAKELEHAATVLGKMERKEQKAYKTPAKVAEVLNSQNAKGTYYEGATETIDYMEQCADAWQSHGIDGRVIVCLSNALKYLSSRLGAKDGASVALDLEKAENYIHRARTGHWMVK